MNDQPTVMHPVVPMSLLRSLFYRHLELGYSRRTSLRLALWCADPDSKLRPEEK